MNCKNHRVVVNVLLLVFLVFYPVQQVVFCQDGSILHSKSVAKTHGNTVTATVYEKAGNHFVYAGGDSGYLDVFRLRKDGGLTEIETFQLFNERGPARGIVAGNIKGKDYLFVGNKGGNAVEVLAIADDGRLKRVFVLNDTEDTFLGTVITLQIVHIGKKSFLFVGGLEETPGLSSFQIKGNGKLVHVQSVRDNDAIHTDGIIGMYTHEINGTHYLYTGGFQDNGVSSFRIDPDGRFENINNIPDNTTDRYLTGAYPVDGVTLGGQHYIIVGHRHHKYYKRKEFIKVKDFVYHGDGVSVFKIDAAGALVPHFVLTDDEQTMLSGQTRIEVLKLDDERAIVAVGTRDDGSIQICELTRDGILRPLGARDVEYPIYYGMASAKVDQDLYFLAGSVDNKVKKFFSYQVDLSNAKPPAVLRHVVSLKYKEGLSVQQVEQAVQAFVNLKNEISSIIDFEWGLNNSEEGKSKAFTHCFTLTFKDEEGREAYLKHPAHLALVSSLGPVLEDVFVMDYWGTSRR